MEALFFLYLAKTMLVIFPFRICLKFVKTREYKNTVDVKQLIDIRNAIGRANRLAFWKNVCLVQSFAARWMLQRRKISSRLSLGLSNNENKELIAHAWLKVSDFEIINEGLNYKEIFFII